jgi:hypothetical protein
MTKYSTTNIKSKGNMLIKEDCMSPPAAAAGAVWANADEMNIIELHLKIIRNSQKAGNAPPFQANLRLYAGL